MSSRLSTPPPFPAKTPALTPALALNRKLSLNHPRALFPLLLLLPILCASGCRTHVGHDGVTTLSQPNQRFEVISESRARIEWARDDQKVMRASLVSNLPVPPLHRTGYNGLMEMYYVHTAVPRKPLSPFVPLYAGFNLEHIINGRAHADREAQFEPRNHPMEIRRISDTVYELYQAPLPGSGVESCTRFEFKDPYIVDVTFECIPRTDDFPYGYLGFFWASYISRPDRPEMWFYGRRRDDEIETVIKAVSPAHGELATHRSALDNRMLNHEKPYPLALVFSESEYEYTRPFFWGRYGPNVLAFIFDRHDLIRFTQSPDGGGEGNPAWDFQWIIDEPEAGKLYRLRYRAVYKPWSSGSDIHLDYENFRFGRDPVQPAS